MTTRILSTCLLIAVAAAALPSPAPAEPSLQERRRTQEIPDSPRARRATAFIEAMQDGSQEALESLVREEFAADLRDLVPMEEHLRRLGGFSELFQAAADVRVGPRSEFVVEVALLDEAGETTRTVVLSIDSEPPHPIVGIAGR